MFEFRVEVKEYNWIDDGYVVSEDIYYVYGIFEVKFFVIVVKIFYELYDLMREQEDGEYDDVVDKYVQDMIMMFMVNCVFWI